jgi:CubicO group peptidase (beta-lactamase class C family)
MIDSFIRSFSYIEELFNQTRLMTRAFFLNAGASILLSVCCSAQDSRPGLDSFFSGLAAHEAFSGNVLVAEGENTLYRRSFGFANMESGQLNNDRTEFKLASISKVFTAVAVLHLMERGRIRLDDPFVKFFPRFPYPGVTIRHMLSHTSGLPDYELFREALRQDPDKICTNEDIIPEMLKRKLPLYFTPGDKWSYCNLNFDLLVLLVEKITHQQFGVWLEKNIFGPAGMRLTHVKTALINAGHLAAEAYNYDYPFLFSDKMVRVYDALYLPRFKRGYYNFLGFVGDGYLYSTTGDLQAFDRALYDGTLLQPATLIEAFTPARLNNGGLANASIGIGKSSYGLGWFILQDSSAGKIVYHTGGDAGCLTIFLRNLDKRQLVVLLANTEHPAAYQEGMSALNILNGRDELVLRKSIVREYGKSLVKGGRDLALGRLFELKMDSLHYRVSGDEFNSLGYQLFNNGYGQLSLEAFGTAALLFPGDWNIFDSYGEILLKQGRKEEAALMYKRSVWLNPKNESGAKVLAGLAGE